MLSKRQTHLFLRLSISIAILGILFKILHWPFAPTILAAGIVGIGVFYAIRFYQKRRKTLMDYSKLALVITFLLHYSFRIFHLAYGTIFTYTFQCCLLVFLILYFKDVFFSSGQSTLETTDNKESKTKYQLKYFLYALAGVGIIVGSIVKILHWQFGIINGDFILVVGLVSAAISVFINPKTDSS
ncbi:GldL-related protein [Flagellimonas sp.]|uniref:GldL-related protein n=1 Tax=Flagellimonas sp. TaxID=2058762 RepID=UPI003BAE64DF